MLPKRCHASAQLAQSMLEAIMAIGIIVSAIAAALALVSGSLNAEKSGEDNIIAANLARESIEVAREIRDTNWLADTPWDEGLSGAGIANDYTAIPVFSPSAGSWSLDFGPNEITNDAPVVYRYTTGAGGPTPGLYVQASAQPTGAQRTQFRRLLTLDAVCRALDGTISIQTSGNSCGAGEKIGVRAASTVRWTSGTRRRQVELVEYLYNWR